MRGVAFTCWNGDGHWANMAASWRVSVMRNSPTWVAECHALASPDDEAVLDWGPHISGNTIKLRAWCDMVRLCLERGDHLVLMDADTLVLGPLDVAFDEFDGDIGFTDRFMDIPDGGKHASSINAGVVFVRPTIGAAEFFDAWVESNDHWTQTDLRRNAARRFGGVNQASLNETLERAKRYPNTRVGYLPCWKWNSVQETWHHRYNECRVIHVKSELRNRVFAVGHIDYWVDRVRDYYGVWLDGGNEDEKNPLG